MSAGSLRFEPGYSPPIFVRVTSPGPLQLSTAKMKIVVRIGGVPHEVEGVLDEVRSGFEHDIDGWGAVIKSKRPITANIYMDFGLGWDFQGSITLEPQEGAYWQATT